MLQNGLNKVIVSEQLELNSGWIHFSNDTSYRLVNSNYTIYIWKMETLQGQKSIITSQNLDWINVVDSFLFQR